jgi:hypothetical protein
MRSLSMNHASLPNLLGSSSSFYSNCNLSFDDMTIRGSHNNSSSSSSTFRPGASSYNSGSYDRASSTSGSDIQANVEAASFTFQGALQSMSPGHTMWGGRGRSADNMSMSLAAAGGYDTTTTSAEMKLSCSDEEEEEEEEMEHACTSIDDIGKLDSGATNEESENSLQLGPKADVDGVQSKLCPRGHWRPAEDEKLRELVSQYGPQNWNLIAEKLQGRSGNLIFSSHCAQEMHCSSRTRCRRSLARLIILITVDHPPTDLRGVQLMGFRTRFTWCGFALQVRAAGYDGSINWIRGSTDVHSQKKRRIGCLQRTSFTETNGP